jgi:hypothetical protein
MPEITSNVSFDTIAREWRCKWSADGDKASLIAAQDALAGVLAEVHLRFFLLVATGHRDRRWYNIT